MEAADTRRPPLGPKQRRSSEPRTRTHGHLSQQTHGRARASALRVVLLLVFSKTGESSACDGNTRNNRKQVTAVTERLPASFSAVTAPSMRARLPAAQQRWEMGTPGGGGTPVPRGGERGALSPAGTPSGVFHASAPLGHPGPGPAPRHRRAPSTPAPPPTPPRGGKDRDAPEMKQVTRALLFHGAAMTAASPW